MTRRHEILTDLVEAIAEAEECSAQELEYSLYEHIDTEAVLSLLTSEQTDWQLIFQVPDHTVEVHGSGTVIIDDTVIRELVLPAKPT